MVFLLIMGKTKRLGSSTALKTKKANHAKITLKTFFLLKTNLIQFPSGSMDFNFKNANVLKLAENKARTQIRKASLL